MLRLLADDLTGALDSAAEFCGLFGPIPVGWAGTGSGSQAIDTGTREASRAGARAALRRLAPVLAGAELAFKKLDSLLRGNPAAELAECLGAGDWHGCVLAPAFPAMGRVTRDGRQCLRDADGSLRVVADLHALFAAEGIAIRRGDPAEPLARGVTLFEAADDAALARIVACGRAAPSRVLWCGSGGLAGALAAAAPAPMDGGLRRPVLGLVGSDQPVAARQLEGCGGVALRVADGSAASATRVADQMAEGVAMVGFALPGALSRDQAAAHIAATLAGLAERLPAPATLLVAGGETLRALCRAVGADGLRATGLVTRGVPRAVILGGRWDGVAVVSKSGAFGGDALWRDLLARNGLLLGTEAA